MNCKICGKENISPSMGGVDICGACDCGVPPEVSKLRRENQQLRDELFNLKFSGEIQRLKTNPMTTDKDRNESKVKFETVFYIVCSFVLGFFAAAFLFTNKIIPL